MTAKFFVDTKVLVYAVFNAAADQARRDLALELLDRSDPFTPQTPQLPAS